MHSCVENLPIEIWLIIFRYLEVHDLFEAFQNLNHYFNEILASDHLSFYLQLRKSDANNGLNCIDSYGSDAILNRITYLEPATYNQSGYFIQFIRSYSNQLIRLKSLTIKIHFRDIENLCKIFREFQTLEYLCLTCVPNQFLLETILSITTLKQCQLILWDPLTTIHLKSGFNNNIQKLIITFLKQSNISILNLCLINMLKLKKLQISSQYSLNDQISFFPKQLFILSKLETLSIKLEYGDFMPDCFDCLLISMPYLKRFHFIFSHYELTQLFMEDFIYHWWPIIQQINKIKISFEGYTGIINHNQNNNTQTNLEKYRQILLDQNSQMNNSFQIKWEEKPILSFKLIKINISRS